MEKIKKIRSALRTSFTKTANVIEALLEEKDGQKAKGNLNVLIQCHNKIEKKNDEIMTMLLEMEEEEEVQLDSEISICDEYRTRLECIKVSVEEFQLVIKNEYSQCQVSSVSHMNSDNTYSKKVKLPELNIAKFEGNIRQWLPFWSQFEPIHNDKDLAPVDKFRYLVQATTENSKARKLIDSFPISNENYVQVIAVLKERFGREDLLIEVYIRELLSLIIANTGSNEFSLTDIYYKLECHLRFLETLGVTKGKCAAILCPLLESCMNEDFLTAWQRSSNTQESEQAEDRLTRFMSFMKSEVYGKERRSLAVAGFGTKSSNNFKGKKETNKYDKFNIPTASTLLTTDEGAKLSCIFCDMTNHLSTNCFKARNMTLKDKEKQVKSNNCCFLCLKPNHSYKKCKKNERCTICDQRHSILLCPSLSNIRNNHFNKSIDDSVSSNLPTQNALANINCDNRVILPTVMVNLINNKVNRRVRAVFDTGSQRSYILKSTAKLMDLKSLGEENIVHTLFGSVNTGTCNHAKYKLFLSNKDISYFCNFDVLDQDSICGDLPTIRKGAWMSEVPGRRVDDLLNNSGPIELLIGADVFARLLTGGRQELSCGLVLIETYLGWTIMGKAPVKYSNTSTAMMVTSMFVNDLNISDLWRLDLIGIDEPLNRNTKTESQLATQQHFLNTISINSEGRYEVHLPWKEGHPPLPTSFEHVRKRLNLTVKKLKNDGFYNEYNKVFNEWLSERIIEAVPESELSDNEVHYLPHRHVVKENSTTKLRPVFDASAHEKGFPSLNDCLDKGDNLIELIPSLLIKFRLKKIGIISDIKKAFLQISVTPKDRNYLRFMWLDSQGRLIIFRHRRVVFGVITSPFLLGAVIRYHLSHVLEHRQKGMSCYSDSIIETLIHGFYVDNFITSLDSEREVADFVSEASSIMADAKFDLRGWEFTTDENNKEINVLGLIWNPSEDILKINVENLDFCTNKVTKRVILASAHKLFDPIGFSCPITLCPKLLLRELWQLKVGWDEEVPDEIKMSFLKWKEELKYLAKIKIPRWIFKTSSIKYTIHTFCDASNSAYAAVIFVRTESDHGIQIQLLQAKTRVSPIKILSIPRLELMAAVIGARLYASVISSIPGNYDSYFWSDSTTTLSWIRRQDRWATFVWNRVEEIRKLTSIGQWRHVPGHLNPADIPSRGCSGKKLYESSWWEGPKWMLLEPSSWPSSDEDIDEKLVIQERKKSPVRSMISLENRNITYNWLYRYFSNYEKIVRMVAWIYRFRNNAAFHVHKTFVKREGPLNLEEINFAETKVLRLVQEEALGRGEDTKFTNLRPFKADDGLIRLRTRISNRPDTEDFRYPILLPKDHPIVQRLIISFHVRSCHVGVQGLLSLMRERFWVIGGRRTMKSVLSSCIRCKRQEIKRMEAPTPALPIERVRDASAFEITGIDLAGPFYLRNGEKAWMCLFTCGVVRAVHLELLPSLSTDDFLLGLRRFVARRGRPAIIFSDRGTNFVGAEKTLQKFDWSEVNHYCTVERIQWKFNPPTAAWWGGWWERLIGIVKRLLRRVLGKASLNYVEMQTILCDCESVVNARPLTYLCNDADELIPITPAMFIQDLRGTGVPEIDMKKGSSQLSKRLKYKATLRRSLVERFRSEYLGQLRQQAISKQQGNVKVGDIVLVGSDNIKRVDWPLAKIVELLPGKDNVTRLVRVKTADGTLLRPIQRLYPILEALDDDHLIRRTEVDQITTTGAATDKKTKRNQEGERHLPQTRRGRVIKTPKKLLS